VIVDYHMHLRGSVVAGPEPLVHTVEAIERFVEVAAARGVDEIGFTEHDYYFRQTREVWRTEYQLERCLFDIEDYVGAVVEAKRRGLPVKLGIEVDWWPGGNERLHELLAPYPWDYLLGSVHWVDDLAIDAEPGLWAVRSVDDVWRGYGAAVSDLARSGLVDVLAHPDLAKVFGQRASPAVLLDVEEQIVAAAVAGGCAVELSTAGLRKPIGELYPSPEFLYDFRLAGVPLTLASDAHVPANVGRDFGVALDLARVAGYETVTVFEARVARQEPLGPLVPRGAQVPA
jgi:histidinol-phosphatase (PHP family)